MVKFRKITEGATNSMNDVANTMKQVNNWIKEILQDNYVGVYFHGSLRLYHMNYMEAKHGLINIK